MFQVCFSIFWKHVVLQRMSTIFRRIAQHFPDGTLLPSVFSPRRRCHFTFHQSNPKKPPLTTAERESERGDRKGATLSVGWADGIDNVNWLSQPEIAPTLLALKHIKRRMPSLDFSWGHDAKISTIYYPNIFNEIFIRLNSSRNFTCSFYFPLIFLRSTM